MAKIVYGDKIEIKGKIVSESGNVVEIKLDAGGSMMLSKSDVQLVPDKETKKKLKKEYKKANDTDVASAEVTESEE
jgi:preprotein translocase subunit YajC